MKKMIRGLVASSNVKPLGPGPICEVLVEVAAEIEESCRGEGADVAVMTV